MTDFSLATPACLTGPKVKIFALAVKISASFPQSLAEVGDRKSRIAAIERPDVR
jgi:hypothetical protein